jgi:hypothetical protein
MEFLEMWETILISILNIICNNLEVTVILFIFYYKQPKKCRTDMDLILTKIDSEDTHRGSEVVQCSNSSFEFRNKSSYVGVR